MKYHQDFREMVSLLATAGVWNVWVTMTHLNVFVLVATILGEMCLMVTFSIMYKYLLWKYVGFFIINYFFFTIVSELCWFLKIMYIDSL